MVKHFSRIIALMSVVALPVLLLCLVPQLLPQCALPLLKLWQQLRLISFSLVHFMFWISCMAHKVLAPC